MIRTYILNAPEEPGVQLLLNAPLNHVEASKVRVFGADYNDEDGAEHCFINCDDLESLEVVAYLRSVGFKEQCEVR